MQYILTEYEYKALGPKTRIEQLEQKVQALSQIAAELGDHQCPIDTHGVYCSGCPAEDLCESEDRKWPK